MIRCQGFFRRASIKSRIGDVFWLVSRWVVSQRLAMGHNARLGFRPSRAAQAAARAAAREAARAAATLAPKAAGREDAKELKLCGLAAVQARFARDPASIQRLFFDRPTGPKVGLMCQTLAAARKVYRQVEPAELERISGSLHHGGIVAVVAPAALRQPTSRDLGEWAARKEPVLVLDRIGNAHNLGAIVRTAAFFGLPRIVIPDHAGAAKPTDAAHRVAEGGFEHVEVWQTNSLAPFVRELATAGYEVVGAAARGGRPEARGNKEKPVALLMGNEEHGLDPAVAAACSRLVTIPGSGGVESLNVSVAAAVLMWELSARRAL